MKCWMRTLRIELTSPTLGKTKVFGDNTGDNLSISVSGTKYPSYLKDNGVVSIYNLNYATIVELQIGKFYKIKIYAGYKSIGEPCLIFDGSVAFISQKINSTHDTECYIIYTSDAVALYSQSRMNLTLNSGINLYAAYSTILKLNGINNVSIPEELKNDFITNVNSYSGTWSSILDCVTQEAAGSYIISTDNTEGTVIDITSLKGKRKIKIDNKNIPIAGGNPKVSSEGLTMTLLPIANFKVGDILDIDQSIIDVSTTNTTTYNSNYLDTSQNNSNSETLNTRGFYMITSIAYRFENRGDAFEYNITARALSYLKSFGVDV